MICGVYITTRNEEEARGLIQLLLSEKLIACANIFPIKSFYPWNGVIQECTEVVVLCKTIDSKYPEIVKRVEEVHSYDIPCVLKVPLVGNLKYTQWIEQEVN